MPLPVKIYSTHLIFKNFQMSESLTNNATLSERTNSLIRSYRSSMNKDTNDVSYLHHPKTLFSAKIVQTKFFGATANNCLNCLRHGFNL